MTESTPEDSANVGTEPETAADLPPVEPPSAAFIVQLFVVPAMIVIAVVGVWALR